MPRSRIILILAVTALIALSGCENKNTSPPAYYQVNYLMNEPNYVAASAPSITYTNSEGAEVTVTPNPWQGYWSIEAFIPRQTTVEITVVKNHAGTTRMNASIAINAVVKEFGFNEDPNGTLHLSYLLP